MAARRARATEVAQLRGKNVDMNIVTDGTASSGP